MTVEVNDESRNDLLPPKSNPQLLRADFVPQEFLSRRHFATQFFGTLKFFFGDTLTSNDVLDRHVLILIQKPHPSPPLKGRELKSFRPRYTPTHADTSRPEGTPLREGDGGKVIPSILSPIGIVHNKKRKQAQSRSASFHFFHRIIQPQYITRFLEVDNKLRQHPLRQGF